VPLRTSVDLSITYNVMHQRIRTIPRYPCPCVKVNMSFERLKIFLNEGEVRPARAVTVVALLDLDPRPSAVAVRIQEVLEASPFAVGDAMAAAASSEVVSLRAVGAHDAHGVAAEELRCIATLEAPASRLVHFQHDAVPSSWFNKRVMIL